MSKNKLSTYLAHREEMQNGDLIEWASNSPLGRAIRWFTKKDVNHTSYVVIFDSPLARFLADRRVVLEAMGGGVEPNYLSERLEHFDGAVYWIPLRRDILFQKVALATAYAVDTYMLRKPKYDFGGLVKNAFGKVSANANKYFCSEFCHICHMTGGIVKNEEKARRPGEFGKSYGVTLPRIKIL